MHHTHAHGPAISQLAGPVAKLVAAVAVAEGSAPGKSLGARQDIDGFTHDRRPAWRTLEQGGPQPGDAWSGDWKGIACDAAAAAFVEAKEDREKACARVWLW